MKIDTEHNGGEQARQSHSPSLQENAVLGATRAPTLTFPDIWPTLRGNRIILVSNASAMDEAYSPPRPSDVAMWHRLSGLPDNVTDAGEIVEVDEAALERRKGVAPG